MPNLLRTDAHRDDPCSDWQLLVKSRSRSLSHCGSPAHRCFIFNRRRSLRMKSSVSKMQPTVCMVICSGHMFLFCLASKTNSLLPSCWKKKADNHTTTKNQSLKQSISKSICQLVRLVNYSVTSTKNYRSQPVRYLITQLLTQRIT